MNFATIIKSINKINNIIKNMKNIVFDSKYIDNVYQGLEEGSFNVTLLVNNFNKEIKKISEQVEVNSREIEKLKFDNEKLKNDNTQLNTRVDVLEKGFKSIREDLEYPIISRIMETPVFNPMELHIKEKK